LREIKKKVILEQPGGNEEANSDRAGRGDQGGRGRKAKVQAPIAESGHLLTNVPENLPEETLQGVDCCVVHLLLGWSNLDDDNLLGLHRTPPKLDWPEPLQEPLCSSLGLLVFYQ